MRVVERAAGGDARARVAAVVATLKATVAQEGLLAENWMIPLLSRGGCVLGLGSFRNADCGDAQPGETALRRLPVHSFTLPALPLRSRRPKTGDGHRAPR